MQIGTSELMWQSLCSKVPCLPTQDDPLQSYSWRYGLLNKTSSVYTVGEVHHLRSSRPIPLPRPFPYLLQNRPWHDPSQDCSRSGSYGTSQGFRRCPSTV